MKNQIISVLKKMGLRPLLKNIQKSINYERTIILNGKKIKTLQLYGAICVVNEPWMMTVLDNILKIKSKGIMDVGVNIGQTLMEIKSLKPDIPYIGFEPNASCVMYVEELIRINKYSNVTLVPVGLYKEDGLFSLDLYYDDMTNSGGSIIKDYWAYTNKHPVYRKMVVPVMSLETINKSIPNIDYDIVKIDVEGAEMEVLETLIDEIKSRKPIIVIEILSAYSKENILRVERQNRILEIVNQLNYSILLIQEDINHQLKSLVDIKIFDVNADPNQCNYIFYSNDDIEKVNTIFEKYLK
jgi:FkbM family methyltransferase